MSVLYPRLPLVVAAELANERAGLSVFDLVTVSDTKHDLVSFALTGGNRVTEERLITLQDAVRSCAAGCGYPLSSSSNQAEAFDVNCAVLLHSSMRLYPAEAAHIEMWAFLTTVLLPDVVRWRFPGQATSVERFIGGDRGLRRNTFGRLWWRAYLLNPERSSDDDYCLLRQLSEDEIVQITERPSIASNPALAKAAAHACIKAAMDYPHLQRRTIMREGIKRVRRRIPVICYEMLDERILQSDVDTAFAAAAQSLAKTQMGDSL